MEEFKGKTAIVTGATSGIGQNVARSLVHLGVHVILSGRNAGRGESMEEELAPSGHFIGGDIKDYKLNQQLVEAADQKFGRLDYVVLSAGQLGIGNITSLSVEEWDNTVATNLSSIFYLLRYAIPLMLKTGGGNIVVIGSVAGQQAFPNHPAYCTTKGAIPSFVKQVALDYSPQIRINAVSPAQVITPLLRDSVKAFPNPEEILNETAKKLPMKRLGQPKDIADTVVHLLSERSSWITGSNFIVDGGFLAT